MLHSDNLTQDQAVELASFHIQYMMNNQSDLTKVTTSLQEKILFGSYGDIEKLPDLSRIYWNHTHWVDDKEIDHTFSGIESILSSTIICQPKHAVLDHPFLDGEVTALKDGRVEYSTKCQLYSVELTADEFYEMYGNLCAATGRNITL